MKKIKALIVSYFIIVAFFSFSYAEQMLSLKIGTTWPQCLLSTAIPSGDAEINVGMIIDKKIGFGFGADFLWNTKEKEIQDTGVGKWTVVSAQKSFMFPLMGYFFLDPVPDLIIHPLAKFSIGYNSMIFVTKSDSSNVTQINYPYFFGLIIKASLDALYDIGERSSIFLGLEYQWADMRNASKGEYFDKRDMSGVGLRGGFRVIF
jgi:hypothetical protein